MDIRIQSNVARCFALLKTVFEVVDGGERVYVFVLQVIRKRLAQPLPMVTKLQKYRNYEKI